VDKYNTILCATAKFVSPNARKYNAHDRSPT